MSNARNLSNFRPSASGLVETADLADASVTAAKIAPGAVSASASIASLPLASGKSLTAGRAVSINDSGEVGDYPLINSFGNVVENATNTNALTEFSFDGTTGVAVARTDSGGTVTGVFTGVVISDSGNMVVGGTTQSLSISTSATTQYAAIYYYSSVTRVSNNVFVAMVGIAGSNGSGGAGAYFKGTVLTVDPTTGNVSKGSELSLSRGNSGTVAPGFVSFTQMTDDIGGLILASNTPGIGYNYYTITRSGTTLSSTSDGSEVGEFTAGGVNRQVYLVNSGAIIGALNGTTVKYGSYSSGNLPATYTTTTLISDYNDAGIFWSILYDTYPVATKAVAIYKNSLSKVVMKTFTINQSTGAVTLADTYTLKEDATISTYANVVFACESDTKFVYTYTDSVTGDAYIQSVELDASGTVLGTNIQLQNSTYRIYPRFNTTNTYWAFYYNSRQYMKPYDVAAYKTGTFSFIGFASETTSSSPADVAVAGVASDLTSLTPNTIYYVDNLGTGTITTASDSGVVVGKALTSTQLLIGVSS